MDDRAGAPDDDEAPLRMSELVERSGVSKETIHFYLREGLLPKPHKTRRNMAWYGRAHLERLELIRRLQTEKYLPLEVIKRVLRGGRPRGGGEDLELLAGLFHLTGRSDGGPLGRVELERRSGLDGATVERAARAGLLGDGAGGGFDLDDLRTLEQVRAAAEALGGPGAIDLVLDSFALVARHLEALAHDEARLFFGRLLVAEQPLSLLDGLRRAREAQSRFLAHERARRIKREIGAWVEQIERAIDETGGPSAFALSADRLAALGADAARAELEERAAVDPEAAELVCLVDFTVGRFAALGPSAKAARSRHGDRPRLLTWAGAAAVEAGDLDGGVAALEAAVAAEAPPIARALLGAARVRQCRRTIEQSGAGSALKLAAAGLAELALLRDAPGDDPILVGERLRARLLRGRVYTSLPRFFGTREPGIADLRAALDGAERLTGALVRLGVRDALLGNACWFLAAALPPGDEANTLRFRAAEVDPAGPIAARIQRRVG